MKRLSEEDWAQRSPSCRPCSLQCSSGLASCGKCCKRKGHQNRKKTEAALQHVCSQCRAQGSQPSGRNLRATVFDTAAVMAPVLRSEDKVVHDPEKNILLEPVDYGFPVLMTVVPSQQHSTLAIRASRICLGSQ